MYLFAVRATVQPGKAEEFAQKWQDFYGLRKKGNPEFQQAYFSADRATGFVLTISVWRTKPDEAQVNQDLQAFAAQIADLAAGPASPEWLEVLQHL